LYDVFNVSLFSFIHDRDYRIIVSLIMTVKLQSYTSLRTFSGPLTIEWGTFDLADIDVDGSLIK